MTLTADGELNVKQVDICGLHELNCNDNGIINIDNLIIKDGSSLKTQNVHYGNVKLGIYSTFEMEENIADSYEIVFVYGVYYHGTVPITVNPTTQIDSLNIIISMTEAQAELIKDKIFKYTVASFDGSNEADNKNAWEKAIIKCSYDIFPYNICGKDNNSPTYYKVISPIV